MNLILLSGGAHHPTSHGGGGASHHIGITNSQFMSIMEKCNMIMKWKFTIFGIEVDLWTMLAYALILYLVWYVIFYLVDKR